MPPRVSSTARGILLNNCDVMGILLLANFVHVLVCVNIDKVLPNILCSLINSGFLCLIFNLIGGLIIHFSRIFQTIVIF